MWAARLPRRTCASPGRTRSQPAPPSRSARFFPFSKRERPAREGWAERGRPGSRAPRRKPELPATCSARRAGKSASELPRRQAKEFLRKPPLENTKTFQRRGSAPPPSCGLPPRRSPGQQPAWPSPETLPGASPRSPHPAFSFPSPP